ncbi:exodeoxyribonuclease VII large subunit [Fibrella forsythiae]|uniref:Exodeoxyribonuclease VII large subunit n=1 Tax=Fibrella forsythiae TaxID=2817061 RepID=A0ABS3JGJ9_9BACT|nr:exodeoxyribonuclease VII large subunit [Fibrella forsythiae]MBO0949125.1 exodeoxyribonuclease VII large subunit [Fibrella forsythiae]
MSPIRLSDLAYTIDSVLEENFGGKAMWVLAETSDIKNYPDRQYCFLGLVEREGNQTVAKLDAVIWRKNYPILRAFEAATGVAFARNIQLLMLVSVTYSPIYGMRLEIHQIDHAYTMGNIERERQAVLDTLVREHSQYVWLDQGQYITSNQMLDRPAVWQRIALITAPNSDGWRDFRQELANNPWGYQFVIDEYLTQVQGQGADKAICTQLEQIAGRATPYDAVVIVRGGGSQLDFGAFDTLRMGVAVASFPYPILAGIGHDRNISITDMMCHQSVKTPTKAAVFLIEHNRIFEENCLQLAYRVAEASRVAMQNAREEVDILTDRFRYGTQTYLRNRHVELAEKATTVRHLDPINVLRRGYALLSRNGQILTSADAFRPGDDVQARFADGTVQLIVTDAE